MKLLSIKEWNSLEKYSLSLLFIPFFLLSKESYLFFVQLFLIYSIAVQIIVFEVFKKVFYSKDKVAKRWISLYTTEISPMVKFVLNGLIILTATFYSIYLEDSLLFKVIFIYLLKEIMIYVFYNDILYHKVFLNKINISTKRDSF